MAMSRLSMETRWMPIGNTFLNVYEADAEQDVNFKCEAVQLLPGRKQRRGHSISGAFIPFALRTRHGGHRRSSRRPAADRARYLSGHVAGVGEAELAPISADSGFPSPTASETSPLAEQPSTFWPDTDSSDHSPMPLVQRRSQRPQTAPPEILASMVHFIRMDQLAGAEGIGEPSPVQQPPSNEAQPIRNSSQREAPPALPALLGRETNGMAGIGPAVKIAELCSHRKPESTIDVAASMEISSAECRVGAGLVQRNVSEVAEDLHIQNSTFRSSDEQEARALQPGLLQQSFQCAPTTPHQSSDLQPPALPPGIFATTIELASMGVTPCELMSPGVEDPMPEITTLMIRNLPFTISQWDLMDDLDKNGFKGLYDFLYMPSCFDSGQGKGFAFVNLTSVAAAGALVGKWHKSRRFGMSASDLSLNLSPAAIQGYEANVKKWNAPRMKRVRNPNLRPYVVEDPTKPHADSSIEPASTPSCGGGARKNAQLDDSQGGDVGQQTKSVRAKARKNAQRFSSNSSDVSQQAPVSASKQKGTSEPQCFQPAARVPCAASSDQVVDSQVQSCPHSSTSQCANLKSGLPHTQPQSGTLAHTRPFNQALSTGVLQSPQISESPAYEHRQPPVSDVPSPELGMLRGQARSSCMLQASHGVGGTAPQFGAPNLNKLHSLGSQASCLPKHSPGNIYGSAGNNELSLSDFLPGSACGGTPSRFSYAAQQGMTGTACGVSESPLSCRPPHPPPYPPSLLPTSDPLSRTLPAWAAAQTQTTPFVDPRLFQMPAQHSQVPDYQMRSSNQPPVLNYNPAPFGFS